MARTKYTVTFPAAKAGDEVTWPNAVKVYADANIDRPLGNGYIETAAGSFTGWSDAASVTFTRAGTSDSVTVTTGSPTGTGAAVPSAASGLPQTIVAKTANYTAAAGEFVECDTTSAGFTVTLPAAPAVGALVAVKKISSDTNTLTIAAAGAGTVDGSATATTITQWAGIIVEHKGSDVWRIAASMSTTGPAGTNGNTVLNGSGAPSAGTGVNGDFYIDTTAKNIYGPKAAGAWGSGTAMLGAINVIQDEGTPLTVRSALNFIGASVTATDDAANSRTNVTVTATSAIVGLLPRALASGRYYTTPGSVASLTMSAGYKYCFPFEVYVSTSFTAIGLNISTAAASSVVRLGVYDADPTTGLPRNLMFDAGSTIDSTTTGNKEIAITQTLAAGVYWLAARATGGAPSPYAQQYLPIITGSTTQAGIMQNPSSGYNDAGGGSGVLDSAWGSTYQSSVQVPKIVLKTA